MHTRAISVSLLFRLAASQEEACAAGVAGLDSGDDVIGKLNLIQTGYLMSSSFSPGDDGSFPLPPHDAGSNLMQLKSAVESQVAEMQVEQSDRSKTPFATVPIKFVVIKKTDGTGHLSTTHFQQKVVTLNQYFNGGDPNAVSLEQAKALNAKPSTVDSCGDKCALALCYEGGKYNNTVSITGCYCDDDYCKKWDSYGNLTGPRANAEVNFELQNVSYVVNDEWHDKCCCAYAGGLSYKPQQLEIMDTLIDKNTVRSMVTIITCDMKSTAGQSLISGSKGCAGGPGIMLTHTFGDHTLAHEFGHFFGLYHTFNEECPAGTIGECKAEEVCDNSKNLGDRMDDTPIHKKQGECAGKLGVDSCPGDGVDPLDNIMSYSGCRLSRFTAGQVTKMRQTITDYYPAFLPAGSGAASPKDLPCNPDFPTGVVPQGYAPSAAAAAPAPAAPPATAPCNMEVGQCDTYDKPGGGCICRDATLCCTGHGCGGLPGQRMCLPCSWKDDSFTKDSCL